MVLIRDCLAGRRVSDYGCLTKIGFSSFVLVFVCIMDIKI